MKHKSFFLTSVLAFSLLFINFAFAENKTETYPKPIVLVLSAPSGTGKGYTMNKVLTANPELVHLVSVTTRAPRPAEKATSRPAEKDGVDYKFVSKEKFLKLKSQGKFAEDAEVYGNFYGTLFDDYNAQFVAHKNVIADLDVAGALMLKENLKDRANVVTVFMLPPSIEVLQKRLSGRGTDSKEVVEKRMKEVVSQMEGYDKYDYIILADEDASEKVEYIYKAELLAANRHNMENLHATLVKQSHALFNAA